MVMELPCVGEGSPLDALRDAQGSPASESEARRTEARLPHAEQLCPSGAFLILQGGDCPTLRILVVANVSCFPRQESLSPSVGPRGGS